MTEEDLKDLLSAVRELLQPHLQQSQPLRRLVEIVGQLLIDEARRAEAAGGQPGPQPQLDAAPVPRPAPVEAEVKSSAVVTLRLGEETVNVPVEGTAEEIRRARAAMEPEVQPPPADRDEAYGDDGDTAIDLALMERRCRLKADSCRLFIDRRAAAGDPAAEPPLLAHMNEMIAQAKAMPRCFLWVFFRQRPQPDDAVLGTIGPCYGAMTRVIGLARMMEELGERIPDGDVREILELFAETSSALQAALKETWLTSPDADCADAYGWIRRQSEQRRIYLPRFMSLDDPADPAGAEGLLCRADELRRRIEISAARMKQIEEGFRKIRYHLGQLDGRGRSDAEHHFRSVADAIARLIDLGVPLTDRRFRHLLDARMAASFPQELAAARGVAGVLQKVIEWHEAQANAEPGDDSPVEREWSAQVRQVRSLLAGRTVVIVGGEPRADSRNRIKEAFDLGDVIWVHLSEHGTGRPMLAPIARPETALLLVLIKLVGTLQSEEAAAYAKEAGKPCVFLKAGYNPEQIADAVLQQASKQLQTLSPR